MNVFVTGGAGYIGSVCVEALLDSAQTVTVFDDLSEGHQTAIDERARFIHGSLDERDRLQRALKESNAEAVIHFAANALVGESMTNPGKYFRNNVTNGLNLLDAAVESGVRKLVFSSSCSVYGIPNRVPITEDMPLQPVNPYGESKFMFERILGWYHVLHRLEFVAFRYFNAAGASERLGEHHRIETHLIPNVLKVALGQAPHCEIFGTDYPTPDGTCVRDYIHVSDLVQAHILAMQPGQHGFYNLGNGEGSSVREVIRACEMVTGQTINVRERPRRPGDPPKLIAAAERAMNNFGWKPRFPNLHQIVASAWRWHQKNPHGYPD